MIAVIMAGGKGQRLRPFTYVTPKPLLPVASRNAIYYLLSELKRNGFLKVLISVNYMHEQFAICESYGTELGLDVIIVREEEEMGTVGSLSLMSEYINSSFILLNADLIVHANLCQMINTLEREQADAVVGTTEYKIQVPYGVITKGRDSLIEFIDEKPVLTQVVNTGIYAFSQEAVALIDQEKTDVTDLLAELASKRKKLIAYDIGEKWLDIGSVEDYKRARSKILEWTNPNDS